MQYNQKKIIVALLVVIVGFVLAVGDSYWFNTEDRVWLSIGCSLIASAMVILLDTFLVDAKIDRSIDRWGLDKIYDTRADKNKDSDPKLNLLKYRLDGIAFGLKSFRTGHRGEVEDALKRGVIIRILTMNPDSKFVNQREKEEKEQQGQIKNTINQLVTWANELNEKGYTGKIYIKGYDCMTLDFYWRMDGEIYIGPYWYGYPSQQTITYKFNEGEKGFEVYSKYFHDLWNDKSLTKFLTKELE